MQFCPYKNNSFDVILCLDTLQYLTFKEQEKALYEIKKVTKKGGFVIFTLPNLAHFASRIYFLFFGITFFNVLIIYSICFSFKSL